MGVGVLIITSSDKRSPNFSSKTTSRGSSPMNIKMVLMNLQLTVHTKVSGNLVEVVILQIIMPKVMSKAVLGLLMNQNFQKSTENTRLF